MEPTMSFYSILGGLSVILGPIMRMIYGLVSNYGIAIILFTQLPSGLAQPENHGKTERVYAHGAGDPEKVPQ